MAAIGRPLSTISPRKHPDRHRAKQIVLKGFRDGCEYVRINSLSLHRCRRTDPSEPDPTPEPARAGIPEAAEVSLGFDKFADGTAAFGRQRMARWSSRASRSTAIRHQDCNGVLTTTRCSSNSERPLDASGGEHRPAGPPGQPRDHLRGWRQPATRTTTPGAARRRCFRPSLDAAANTLMVDIEECGGTIRLYDAAGGILLKDHQRADEPATARSSGSISAAPRTSRVMENASWPAPARSAPSLRVALRYGQQSSR